MYPFWTMRNVLASLVNLVTLLIGITVGIILAPHFEKPAHAISLPEQVGGNNFQLPVFGSSPVAAVPDITPKITPVQPMISGGTAGFYMVLSHHVQADELVVNGYDLLKLQNAELQMLSRFVSPTDIRNAVIESKSPELFQISEPKPATPAPQPTTPAPSK